MKDITEVYSRYCEIEANIIELSKDAASIARTSRNDEEKEKAKHVYKLCLALLNIMKDN